MDRIAAQRAHRDDHRSGDRGAPRARPGKLGSVYERALAIELRAREVPFRTQVPIPMLYRGESVGEFFADFIVDQKVIVELKAVDALRSVHRAQVLSYLRATELDLGLLININVSVLEDGVRRLIHSRVWERATCGTR